MKKNFNLYKFFDYFGILVFLFLLWDAIADINSGIVNWRVYTRLIIAIGGIIVDGYLVFFYKDNNNKGV